MANITTSLTGYPSAVDTRTTLTDDPNGSEIVAAHPNGVASAVIAVETELGISPKGAASTVVARLNVSQNSDGSLKSSILQAGTGSTITYANGVFTVTYSADSAQLMQNVGLSAGVSGNALTVTMTDRSNAALSSTSSAVIPFRSTTLASGTYTVRTIPTPTSVVLPSGGTLGSIALQNVKIWCYGLDVNSTTFELALARQATFDDAILQTTTAISAGSTDNNTMYSTTGRNSVPVKCLGYVEITGGSVAGNWSNNPTKVQLFGPGVFKTGEIVQVIMTTSGGLSTGTTTIPEDDTIPQVSEGNPFFHASMTPQSAANLWRHEWGMNLAPATSTEVATALFQGTQINAQAVTRQTPGAGEMGIVTGFYETTTSTIASTTFVLRAGTAGGATTFNGLAAGTRSYGGRMASFYRITEVAT